MIELVAFSRLVLSSPPPPPQGVEIPALGVKKNINKYINLFFFSFLFFNITIHTRWTCLPISVKAYGSIILINVILNATYQQALRKSNLQLINTD